LPEACSALGRALEFDAVPLRILEVKGRPDALGPEGVMEGADLEAMAAEMGPQGPFIEGFDSQADMIEIVAFRRRPRPSPTTQFPVDRHQIDQAAASRSHGRGGQSTTKSRQRAAVSDSCRGCH